MDYIVNNVYLNCLELSKKNKLEVVMTLINVLNANITQI